MIEDTDWRPSACPFCGRLRVAARDPRCQNRDCSASRAPAPPAPPVFKSTRAPAKKLVGGPLDEQLVAFFAPFAPGDRLVGVAAVHFSGRIVAEYHSGRQIIFKVEENRQLDLD